MTPEPGTSNRNRKGQFFFPILKEMGGGVDYQAERRKVYDLLRERMDRSERGEEL